MAPEKQEHRSRNIKRAFARCNAAGRVPTVPSPLNAEDREKRENLKAGNGSEFCERKITAGSETGIRRYKYMSTS